MGNAIKKPAKFTAIKGMPEKMVSVFIRYKHNVFWFLNICQSFESCFIPYLKLELANVVLHTELHGKCTSKSDKSSSKLQMVELLEIRNHDSFSYLQWKKEVREMEFGWSGGRREWFFFFSLEFGTHRGETESWLLRSQRRPLGSKLRAELWRMRSGWTSLPQGRTRSLWF